MEPDEELKMILEKLQWASMRFRETQAEFQIKLHELMTTQQALIDHMEGRNANDRYNPSYD